MKLAIIAALVLLAPLGAAHVGPLVTTTKTNVDWEWRNQTTFGGNDCLAQHVVLLAVTPGFEVITPPPITRRGTDSRFCIMTGTVLTAGGSDGAWNVAWYCDGCQGTTTFRVNGQIMATSNGMNGNTAQTATDASGLHVHQWIYVGDFQDTDGDGASDDEENAVGSNPLNGQSTPDSDDDRDGTPNRDEAGPECTGTYGFLLDHGCGGYPAPGTNCVGSAYLVRCDTGFWAWDPICLAAPNCPTSYDDRISPEDPEHMVWDGYGWRRILGQFFQIMGEFQWVGGCPDMVPTLDDGDGDAIPNVAFCRHFGRIEENGTIYPDVRPSAPLTSVGDRDPGDPDKPVSQEIPRAIQAILTDYDGDGYPTTQEGDGRSNPTNPASTPASDDDGDGTSNQAEPSPDCTGAFGIVRPPSTCGGYPGGGDVASGLTYRQGEAVWVWDGICIPTEPFTAAWYEHCRATSYQSREPTDPLYTGTYWSDGYGWRYQGTIGPVEFPAPCLSSCTVDADGDDVPTYRVCRRTIDLSGNLGPETNCEPVGDPDDADPNNPVPNDTLAGILAAVNDADGDGDMNQDEATGESNPFSSASTGTTDDDGDGQLNRDEGGGPTPCSGSLGIVFLPACGGYSQQSSNGIYQNVNDVWIFDAVCYPGGHPPVSMMDYAHCRATSNYQTGQPDAPVYGGTYWDDGYGWRHVGTQPFQIPSITTVDQDGDGVLVVRACMQDAQVVGTELQKGPEEDCQVQGDADDNDPNSPIDLRPIQDLIATLDAVVADFDGDGTGNAEEIQAGYDPTQPWSKPGYDADGNPANPDACGSRGYLVRSAAPGCGAGYAGPDGTAPPADLDQVVVRPDGGVWTWDAICLRFTEEGGCHDGNYAGTNQLATPASMATDGYGWRRIGTAPALLPKSFTYKFPCDQDTSGDADGDGIPYYRLCDRTTTITPTGAVTHGPSEANPIVLGDTDDGDPDAPVPYATIQSYEDLLLGSVEEQRAAIGAFATEMGAQVEAIRQGLDDDLEELTGAVLGLLDEPGNLTAAFIDAGLQLVAAANQSVDAARGIAQAILAAGPVVGDAANCAATALLDYAEAFAAAVEAWAIAPTPETADQLEAQVAQGGAATAAELQECGLDPGIADALGNSLSALADGLEEGVFDFGDVLLQAQDEFRAALLSAVTGFVGQTFTVLDEASQAFDDATRETRILLEATREFLQERQASTPFANDVQNPGSTTRGPDTDAATPDEAGAPVSTWRDSKLAFILILAAGLVAGLAAIRR